MRSSRSARCWDFETSRGIDFRLPIRDAEGNPYTLISIGDSTFIRLTFDRVFLPDTNSVTPWAKLDAGTQKAYFNRFGADAEPPFGLTLETTDHMLGDQWIAHWNPGAVGTRIIFR